MPCALAAASERLAPAGDPVLAAALSSFTRAAAADKEWYAPGSPVGAVTVYPSFLFTREGSEPCQVIKVSLENRAVSTLAVTVRVERPDGRALATEARLRPGRQTLAARAPDARTAGPLAVRVTGSDGREYARLDFTWQPARQWTIYLTHLSHFDWGYTGTHAQVREKWDEILATALRFSAETADWPEAARFHYTLDAAYPLRNFFERYPGRVAEVRELVASGRWETTAKFAHLCTSVSSPEVLARELYYSKRELDPLLATDSPTAIMTDVPGVTWGDAGVLAGAGVKYLLHLPNRTSRGAGIVTSVDFPHAYYWQGPAGDRLLVWRAFWSYVEGRFLIEGLLPTARQMPPFLQSIADKGYPFDLVHFTRSGLDPVKNWDDNSLPRLELFATIRLWNDRFAFPRLVASTPRVFFGRLEAEHGGEIPSFAADMPDWWADAILSDAREAGQVMVLHHTLADFELFSGLARLLLPGYRYPAAEARAAYEDAYLFDEHTWGYMFPTLPAEGKIWKTKTGWLYSGLELSRSGLGRALGSLGRAAGGGPGVRAVFNPLGFATTQPVRVELPAGQETGAAVTDLATGESVATQASRADGRLFVTFVARAVPAFGRRLYRVTPGPAPAGRSAIAVALPRVENQFFTLTFDRGRAGLVSLVDRRLGRELIDPAAPYALGRLIARKQGWFDLYDLRLPARGISVAVSADGPLFTTISVTQALPDAFFTAIRCDYTLYRDLPWIDLTLALDLYRNGAGAAKYLAFPFAVPDHEITLAIPYARMRPGIDQLPGMADYYAVSNWVDIRSRTAGFGVTWSALEGPLVEFGGMTKASHFMNPNAFKSSPPPAPPRRPWLYSEVMHNYENTNYHVEQDGSARWHYRIAVHGDLPPAVAGRSGEELARPLLLSDELPAGGDGGAETTFLELTPDTVTLVTLKAAEDGRGLILRMVESGGGNAAARVRFPARPILRACLTDIAERDGPPLPVAGGAAEIAFSPFAIRTVRLEFQP
jgi:hypothetical protein